MGDRAINDRPLPLGLATEVYSLRSVGTPAFRRSLSSYIFNLSSGQGLSEAKSPLAEGWPQDGVGFTAAYPPH
ncbi:MAG: hypothetical protein ACFB0G_08815 [Leptolyngbyaceae cyanobacterium]